MKKKISIVIPCYNEEKSLPVLYDELSKTINSIDNYEWEILFINDGSKDETINTLKSLAENNNNVKAINFTRNFGHQAALTAGYELSDQTSDAVICMDGDLQHPPELIVEMIKKWEEGYDVVQTIRRGTEKQTFIKKITSKMFYWVMSKMTDVEIIDGAADFRLLDKKTVMAYNLLKEKNRFIRGLISWLGFKTTTIPYYANERKFGKSKYSFGKMLKFAEDGIYSFSTKPLEIIFFIGIILSCFAFIYFIYSLYIKFVCNAAIQGWTSIIIIVLITSGFQFISLGIIGKYIARIYGEAKQRPTYIVKNIFKKNN